MTCAHEFDGTNNDDVVTYPPNLQDPILFSPLKPWKMSERMKLYFIQNGQTRLEKLCDQNLQFSLRPRRISVAPIVCRMWVDSHLPK